MEVTGGIIVLRHENNECHTNSEGDLYLHGHIGGTCVHVLASNTLEQIFKRKDRAKSRVDSLDYSILNVVVHLAK